MKKIYALVATVFALSSAFAQTPSVLPIDEETKKVTFAEVVTVEGVTKDELYARAKNLGVLGNNTKTDNPAEGIYVYKGQIKVNYPAPQPGLQHNGVVDYLVTIACKDGRYKYTITDFKHSGEKASGGKLEGTLPECGKYTLTLTAWGSIKKQTKDQMDKFIEALKAKMAVKASTGGNKANDW